MRIHPARLIPVVLAALAVIPATATAAGQLKPPVVKEKFTPLPCKGTPSHRTTIEMLGCAERQILASDKTINRLNQRVFETLTTNRAKARFISSNTSWVSFRGSWCATAGARFAGGTEQPVLVATCTASLNTEHVNDLQLLLPN
jgi:uncharacterized protein YecT (DUF1311 family)